MKVETSYKLMAKVSWSARLRKDWRRQLVLLALIVPAIAYTIIFNYKPIYGIIMAFQDFDLLKGISGSDFVGLDNFKAFLEDPDFIIALRNTVAISLLNLLIGFPIPIVFALLLNEFRFRKMKKVVQSITYLPHFISWVIISGLLYRLLDQDSGSVNMILGWFGIESIGFFREPSYFWMIFILSSLWKEMGWNSILYLSAMTSINPELYEAAAVDGAGKFKRAWHVTIPGIMPTIIILFILSVSSLFSSSFDALYPMRNVMIASTSDTIDVFTYFKGIRMGEYGYATAVGLTQSIIGLILLFTVNKTMKKLTGYSLF